MKIKSAIILLLLFMLPIRLVSQSSQSDLSQLSYDKLWKIFFQKYKSNSICLPYAEAYLKKANRENHTANIGRAYYLFAFDSYDKNNGKAVRFLDKALPYSKKGMDNFLIAKIYFDKAGLLQNQHKYREAVRNFILAEKSNKDLDYAFIIKLNIAVLKSEYLGEIDEALVLYKECFNYYKNKGVKKPIYQEVLFDIADAYKAKNLPDSATFYNILGYKEAKFSKDNEMLNLFILNEGANHVVRKNYKAALDSIKKALPKIILHKNDGNTLAGYYYLGKTYEEIGNIGLAVNNYKKVDSIYGSTKIIAPEFLSGYHYLISYYEKKGDKINELKYLSALMKIDSTIQSDYKDIYKTLQKDYEVPRLIKDKENLISSLKEDKYNSYLGIGVMSLLIMGASGFGYYQFRQKKEYRNRFEKIIAKASSSNLNSSQTVIEASKIKIEQPKDLGIASDLIEQILEKLEKFEINKKFLEPSITIIALSDEFETNSKYLSRIVNSYKNKTFIQYVNDLRIDYAVLQLQENAILRKYTLSALAKEFGFNTVESFTGAFYKKTGIKTLYFIKELENKISSKV